MNRRDFTRFAFLTGTLILFVSFRAGAQMESQPWKRYTVVGGEMSVMLPTVPSMTTSESRWHEKKQWSVTLGVYAEGLIYQVNVYENVEGLSLADFIGRQTANSETDGPTERKLVVNGVSGKEYSFPHSLVPATTQFFATESRLYRFGVGGATADDPRVGRFLSSIVLGAKQDGIVVGDGPGVPFHPDYPDDVAYVGKEIDRKVRVVIKPEPAYTEQAKQAAITGTVVLKVVFTSGGNVSNIRIVSGLPYGLTDNAIAAAKKIKFYPALKNGKYVSMWMQLEYNFNLF